MNIHLIDILLFFFGWVLHCTNTVMEIWRLSSFTGGGRPQVPFCALFQAQVGTQVEQLMFRNSEKTGS